jgi:hypothetical protein
VAESVADTQKKEGFEHVVMVLGRANGSEAGCEDMDASNAAPSAVGEWAEGGAAARRADGDSSALRLRFLRTWEYSIGVIDFHSSLVNDSSRDNDGTEVRRERYAVRRHPRLCNLMRKRKSHLSSCLPMMPTNKCLLLCERVSLWVKGLLR